MKGLQALGALQSRLTPWEEAVQAVKCPALVQPGRAGFLVYWLVVSLESNS